MSYWFFVSASFISLGSAIFHGFVGARIYLDNISQSDMTKLTKSLSLLSWHVFTIFLLVSAVTFAWLAYYPRFESAAYPLIGINFLGATLFFFLGFGNHKNLMKLPGAYLMSITGLLGLLAVV